MEKGLYYNVPGKANIKIFNNNTTFCEGEYPFAQFGETEILSNVLFDKDATTKVTFYQSTGAIEQINRWCRDIIICDTHLTLLTQ